MPENLGSNPEQLFLNSNLLINTAGKVEKFIGKTYLSMADVDKHRYHLVLHYIIFFIFGLYCLFITRMALIYAPLYESLLSDIIIGLCNQARNNINKWLQCCPETDSRPTAMRWNI